ncbi:MAG: hypothetical protein HY742_09045 [Deltaproteobacteria bacterium]|nr:hypothetical protein [Deltaproteobacteria bacterium]
MGLEYEKRKIRGLPPYSKTSIDLSTAEVSDAIYAVAGLSKSLAKAAGGVAAIALGCAILSSFADPGIRYKPAENNPLGSWLVRVETEIRKFIGFITDDILTFTCEDNRLESPYSIVKEIYGTKEEHATWCVRLVDGSLYRDVTFNPITFLTPVGIQMIDPSITRLRSYPGYAGFRQVSITGINTDDIRVLRTRLEEAISYNYERLREILGDDLLEGFFKRPQRQIGQ